ncbi:proline-rich receptor-like protein kinase PERK9 [Schistocerca americana]|uniref:proline-rich receptor-like protein kinase PERK9 n=1 Tax=Schistocerca americana TaxID=7009 RepID=UPI001F4FD785|nr:proline-rich receptor-like protein kinase PERK9 [Schistocerca americana]
MLKKYGYLVHGGFQPRLPTSLPPPGQQQQQEPSPLPRRQPVPLMPPAQLHPGAPQVVAPAPAVTLQSPPPSELMDVDPSAGPPSQAVAVQPVLQPLSLGTPKESDTAAPCPAPTQQPSTQRQETLPLFVGPDAPSRPVPEAAPVVTGVWKVTEWKLCAECVLKADKPVQPRMRRTQNPVGVFGLHGERQQLLSPRLRKRRADCSIRAPTGITEPARLRRKWSAQTVWEHGRRPLAAHQMREGTPCFTRAANHDRLQSQIITGLRE